MRQVTVAQAKGSARLTQLEIAGVAFDDVTADFDLADGTLTVPAFKAALAGANAAPDSRQGALEGSNVEAAETMVEMISSLRSFEAGQKVLHSIDETLQKSIQMGGPSS